MLLLVSVWLMLSVSYAQTTTLDGPEATMLPNASTWVLENNQDELVFATLNPGINGSVEDLRIYHYNKATRKMTEQSVDDDLECRFVFPKEDLWCVVNMVIDEHGKWLPGQLGRASQNVCLSGSPCSRSWLSASQA